jgi:hypothetical protein
MTKRPLRPLSLAAIVLAALLGSHLASGCGGDSGSAAYNEYVSIGNTIDDLGAEVEDAVHSPSGSDARIARQFAAFGRTARRYAGELERLEVGHDLVAPRNKFGAEIAAYGDLLGAIGRGAGKGDTDTIVTGLRELSRVAKAINADGQVFAQLLEEEG